MSLRSMVIKLALDAPELRKHLVPLLKQSRYTGREDEDAALDRWSDEAGDAESVLRKVPGVQNIKIPNRIDFDQRSTSGEGSLNAQLPVSSFPALVIALTRYGFVLDALRSTPADLKAFRANRGVAEDKFKYAYFKDSGKVRHMAKGAESWVECEEWQGGIELTWSITVPVESSSSGAGMW